MLNTRTQQYFIASVVTFVSMLLVLLFMVSDSDSREKQLRADMQVILDKEIIERDHFKLQELLEETSDQRDNLSTHVLEGEDGAISLLSIADEMAADLGVQLETEQLNVISSKDNNFNDLEVAFSVLGDEHSIMKILQLFELVPYRSEVTSLTVTRNFDSSARSSLTNARLVMRVSMIKE